MSVLDAPSLPFHSPRPAFETHVWRLIGVPAPIVESKLRIALLVVRRVTALVDAITSKVSVRQHFVLSQDWVGPDV